MKTVPLPGTLALALCAAVAVAQPATVTVAGQVKRTEATVSRLTSGDAACFVELKDEQGRSVQEMAEFEVCNQRPSIEGRRVALTWKVASVASASCGGDPACRRSDRVPLIAAARIVEPPVAATTATPAAAVAGVAAASASWCAPPEQVVFACRLGAKLVSVCSAKDPLGGAMTVQYRFGRADATGTLEMQLPDAPGPAARVATADMFPLAGGGGSWMRLRRGDHAYVVYSAIGRWGPNGTAESRAGVVVERGGKRLAALRCTGPVSSELGPDWFGRAGLDSRGEDFDLPP